LKDKPVAVIGSALVAAAVREAVGKLAAEAG
jgi:hypothetical protein